MTIPSDFETMPPGTQRRLTTLENENERYRKFLISLRDDVLRTWSKRVAEDAITDFLKSVGHE